MNKSVVERSDLSGEVASESLSPACGNCLEQGRPVSRKTVMLMLKPHLLDQAMTGKYSFCSMRHCPVVYFEDQSNRCFTVDDLRTRVGLKAKEDPIPFCYCFGFEESDMREELSRTGETTIPETISRLIREGLCACDTRNPSGMCCLGEVNKAAKLLKLQLSDTR
ncbi:MAG: hypothetical protein LC775_04755 [Acidobacteria bacterium]|nr:hypothetical protein [Acidobacteriota bacterium]